MGDVLAPEDQSAYTPFPTAIPPPAPVLDAAAGEEAKKARPDEWVQPGKSYIVGGSISGGAHCGGSAHPASSHETHLTIRVPTGYRSPLVRPEYVSRRREEMRLLERNRRYAHQISAIDPLQAGLS